jgi:hypothetical protein
MHTVGGQRDTKAAALTANYGQGFQIDGGPADRPGLALRFVGGGGEMCCVQLASICEFRPQ